MKCLKNDICLLSFHVQWIWCISTFSAGNVIMLTTQPQDFCFHYGSRHKMKRRCGVFYIAEVERLNSFVSCCSDLHFIHGNSSNQPLRQLGALLLHSHSNSSVMLNLQPHFPCSLLSMISYLLSQWRNHHPIHPVSSLIATELSLSLWHCDVLPCCK